MKKIKLGFFKKPQGIFTEKIIKNIEARLKKFDFIELHTGLDFREGHVVNGRVFVNDFDLNTLDVYFWHDAVRAFEWNGDSYLLNILLVLENDCLVINSSEATRIVSDKFLSHNLLFANSLPVVDFALVDAAHADKLNELFNDFGGSIVIKPRFGGWGVGVELIDSRAKLEDFVKKISSSKEKSRQVLVEKYFENDLSKWIAVVVFGNKVLFGYHKKIMSGSDWKIYDPEKKDSQGDYSEYLSPPKELQKIALKAKNIIGKDIIGFDFIYTKEGYKIVDENGRPGLYTNCIKKAGVNIEDEVINLILDKIKTL
ncbi:hypothetical protein KJ761_02535 [Patescibacteria group bacterium]|nr:hypothetical protein [Patescibacteria group bacterium]